MVLRSVLAFHSVRPVVVIRKHRTNLVTVVPLSTTAPDRLLDHHLELRSHLHGASPTCWAKCDMVATVSLSRLDLIKSRDRQGKRVYVVSQLETDEFYAIKIAVRSALCRFWRYAQRLKINDVFTPPNAKLLFITN
ncbi:type II toxin-antitoxin system PemK/MazF family toxin [Pseudomonas sp. 14P_8.1_Bac3]|uniref:type II toxin-antitoxin system PemK/MazF family toxin n=1 Tax=Pseudomonas sp. 14P_8.1_Bac3 TaxID=2971621 RepID=UPI0021C8C820|nr:type II toxin-antitoxin system PemK/MazF family toxin [Pseudomonas sp. 14P_8.1_Bac3]MCU1759039.1 type II toxin-antitoxin system PemK/MazF family toxin [Pseudomonas sp. 14P_8.1_Bac3]